MPVLSVWELLRTPLCAVWAGNLTQGQVTRRDLRPHDCEQIWPDLANEIQQPQKEAA